MLSVTGLCGLPHDLELKINETPKGYYLNFVVSCQDPVDESKYHRYHASMWIPTTDYDKWMEALKPANVFYIASAKWSMKEVQSNFDAAKTITMPTLLLDHKEFRKLRTPKWFEKKTENQ